MNTIFKGISYMITIFIALILFALLLNMQNTLVEINNPKKSTNSSFNITAYSLKNSSIISSSNQTNSNISINDADVNNRVDIINRAKAMVEVSWTPNNNIVDSIGHYIFLKGKTYKGVPYSMGSTQVNTTSDFLANINKSNKLYGNDCSGFVSTAWGVSRQTTLSLYNAIKNRNKIDGKSVISISWEELKPGDAILRESGNGKGHIVLFINYDEKNNDSIHVYEQNIGTLVPFAPIPTAREDQRSKKTLQKTGYMPIRLKNS